jgi:SAM-dependent methyltransferase
MEQRFTFDQAASLYSSARPDYPPTLRDEIVSIVGLRPEDAILDVGCDTGEATRRFAPLGYRIVALDPGAQIIEIARELERIRQYRICRLDVRGLAGAVGGVPARDGRPARPGRRPDRPPGVLQFHLS